MSFPVTVGLLPGDEKETSTDKLRALGTRGQTPDGRVFYWAQNGATQLEGNVLVQTAVMHGASVHGSALDVVGATTTGKTTITVTLATTDAGRDLYADGYLSIDTSPGRGMYQIDSHAAGASAADVVFNLKESDPLRDALTSGTTKVGIRQNPYRAVVVTPTTKTGIALGTTSGVVAASGAAVDGIHADPVYFWVQTFGPALVKADAAFVAGSNVITPGASAGNATPAVSTAGEGVFQIIGTAPTIGAGDEKFNFIFLSIRA